MKAVVLEKERTRGNSDWIREQYSREKTEMEEMENYPKQGQTRKYLRYLRRKLRGRGI